MLADRSRRGKSSRRTGLMAVGGPTHHGAANPGQEQPVGPVATRKEDAGKLARCWDAQRRCWMVHPHIRDPLYLASSLTTPARTDHGGATGFPMTGLDSGTSCGHQ